MRRYEETAPIDGVYHGYWYRMVVQEFDGFRHTYEVRDNWDHGRLLWCEVRDPDGFWLCYEELGHFPAWTRRERLEEVRVSGLDDARRKAHAELERRLRTHKRRDIPATVLVRLAEAGNEDALTELLERFDGDSCGEIPANVLARLVLGEDEGTLVHV